MNSTSFWFEYCSQLFIGLFFFSVGVILLFRLDARLSGLRAISKLHHLDPQARKTIGAGFTGMGLIFIVVKLCGPLPTEQASLVQKIVRANPDQLQAIQLRSQKMEVIITNRSELAEICSVLHDARTFSPNHPRRTKTVRMIMRWKNEVIWLDIDYTENNGVLMYVFADWVKLRCDPLGGVVESLLNSHQVDDKHKIGCIRQPREVELADIRRVGSQQCPDVQSVKR